MTWGGFAQTFLAEQNGVHAKVGCASSANPCHQAHMWSPLTPWAPVAFKYRETGVYVMTANVGFNADVTNGASFGPSDFFSVIVCPQGGLPTAATYVVLKPWDMTNTNAAPSGSNFSVSGTAMGIVHSGVWYQFAVWMDNLSGATSCPADIALPRRYDCGESQSCGCANTKRNNGNLKTKPQQERDM